MARRANQPKLDTPTARARLAARHAAYWNNLSRGFSLGYRRAANTKAGMWYFKFVPSKEAGIGRVEEALGAADDKLPADSITIFSYELARKRASDWLATALQKSTGVVPRRRDYTVLDACDDYLNALEGRKPTYIPRKVINAVVVPALGKVVVDHPRTH